MFLQNFVYYIYIMHLRLLRADVNKVNNIPITLSHYQVTLHPTLNTNYSFSHIKLFIGRKSLL